MKQLNRLKLEQGRLWDDHYWLTRQVIVSATYTLPCFDEDLKYLNANQVALGNNFAQLTGNGEAGHKLTHLLLEHIAIAVQIVSAAIAGNPIDDLYKEWVENGIQIAKTYHHYNNCIKLAVIEEHMQTHLDTTLAEAVAIINKNCEESAKLGDVALIHIRLMADYINSKFCCSCKCR